jgi:hypothetical protein
VAGLTTCSVGQLFVGRKRRMWPRIEDTPIEPISSVDGRKVGVEELVIKASRVRLKQTACSLNSKTRTNIV